MVCLGCEKQFSIDTHDYVETKGRHPDPEERKDIKVCCPHCGHRMRVTLGGNESSDSKGSPPLAEGKGSQLVRVTSLKVMCASLVSEPTAIAALLATCVLLESRRAQTC